MRHGIHIAMRGDYIHGYNKKKKLKRIRIIKINRRKEIDILTPNATMCIIRVLGDIGVQIKV